MRDLGIGLLGAIAAFAIWWPGLLLAVALEGLGPGDTLSPLGVILPTLAGAACLALFVRSHARRLVASFALWSIPSAVMFVRWNTHGSLDDDFALYACVTLGVHAPALFVVLLGRRRFLDSGPSSD